MDINFTSAKFNNGDNINETSIVSSTGDFLITWNFNFVKRGVLNKYKIKNLRGVLPSFILTIEQVTPPKDQGARQQAPAPVYEEPPKRVEPPQSPPTSSYSPNSAAVRLPKYITTLGGEEGIPCASCGRLAGPGSSGRYCIQCGTKIP